MLFDFGNWCSPTRNLTTKGKGDQTRHTRRYSNDSEDDSNFFWWHNGKVRKPWRRTKKSRRESPAYDRLEESDNRKRKDKSSQKQKRTSNSSCQSEGHLHSRGGTGIFRKRDGQSIKSEPIHTSILAESFYSDDSLENGDLTYEVDYMTATPLFEALEENDWSSVLFFLRTGKFFSNSHFTTPNMDDPDNQVRTWVHCRDDQEGILWRQLPLHAAICQSAPLRVIQRLVDLYPEALRYHDHFGNLPFDLANKLYKPGSYILEAVRIQEPRSIPFVVPPSHGNRDEAIRKWNGVDTFKTNDDERQQTYSTDDDSSYETEDGEEVLAMVNDDEFDLYYY